jgi:tetraacyldisaccharide 4'-kinase
VVSNCRNRLVLDRVQTTLVQAWNQRGALARALWPVSVLYGLLWGIRRQLYQMQVLRSHRVKALVIVVGNVITGGAGKTPTVVALVRHLQRRGLAVGVVSRGYGRKRDECLEVLPQSHPSEVGDEPLLLQRALTVPVFVARDRHAAATALLAKYAQTQVIVADDGLQHYALYRDLEVCVFDDRGYGNGWLLPAGPLREPWPHRPCAPAGQTDRRWMTLHTGTRPAFQGYTANRSLADFAIGSEGQTVSLESLRIGSAKPLLAMAGIGQPDAFFDMLRAKGVPLEKTVALPDHYAFDSLSRTEYGRYSIICTEKDAIKLWEIEPTALAVPLELDISAGFFETLDSHLSELFAARLSSTHGHQTT